MKELIDRRNYLFERMKENSVAIIFSGVAKVKSEDELYRFQSNRNFFYLTNIEQENSILMLIKSLKGDKVYLFVDEYDEMKEKWTGKRLTFEQASEISSINNVFSTSSFENMTKLALTSTNNQYGKIDTLYIDFSSEQKIKENLFMEEYKTFINNEYPNVAIANIYQSIVELRMVKDKLEIDYLRQAINETSKGISQLLLRMNHNMKEHELADFFEYYGKTNELDLSFSTIVASGKNATCLHYPSQKSYISSSDIILFDLGYKFKGYCADISRSYPVDGIFKGKGRDIYEAVLNTNKAVISYIRSGLTINQLQEYTIEMLKKECLRLHLLNNEDDIKKVYFHKISHHLGLDTHDVNIKDKPLEVGNVITVEPGLYFADLGIGVRIEDDVLVKEDMCECLSISIPKEIKDIEKLLASKGGVR